LYLLSAITTKFVEEFNQYNALTHYNSNVSLSESSTNSLTAYNSSRSWILENSVNRRTYFLQIRSKLATELQFVSPFTYFL
jgi:dipeptidase